MQIPSNIPPSSGGESAHVNAQNQTATTERPKGDAVKLTSHAKAKFLKQQGASNSAIASRLGLDIKVVDGYFSTGIKTKATDTTTTAQPSSPAPEAIKTAPGKV